MSGAACFAVFFAGLREFVLVPVLRLRGFAGSVAGFAGSLTGSLTGSAIGSVTAGVMALVS